MLYAGTRSKGLSPYHDKQLQGLGHVAMLSAAEVHMSV